MNKDYYFEKGFKGSIEEIIELFLTEFGQEIPICNYEFLKWQYFENPNGNAIIVGCRSFEDNKLVGIYIVNPVNLVHNGKIIKSALSLNTFTRKDFRGLGLFPKMAEICYKESAENDINCIIGFPNDSSYPGFLKKLNFADLGDVTQLFKPLSVFDLLKMLFKIDNKNIRKKSFIQKSNNSNYKIEKLGDPFISKFASFLGNYNKDAYCTTERNSNYISWRYFKHPFIKYYAYTIESDNEIKAYIIFSLENKKVRLARVVEFCVSDKFFGLQLLKNINRILKNDFCCSIVLASAQTETKEFEIYKKCNFFIKRKSLFKKTLSAPFILRNLENHSFKPDIRKWNIVGGDCDVL